MDVDNRGIALGNTSEDMKNRIVEKSNLQSVNCAEVAKEYSIALQQ